MKVCTSGLRPGRYQKKKKENLLLFFFTNSPADLQPSSTANGTASTALHRLRVH